MTDAARAVLNLLAAACFGRPWAACTPAQRLYLLARLAAESARRD